MTLEQLRAETDRAMRPVLAKLYWESQVNHLLDHNPNSFLSLRESEKAKIRELKPLIAIFEQIRAMGARDFQKPSTRLLWMNLVNQVLAKEPGFMGLKEPITPAQMGLDEKNKIVSNRFAFRHTISRGLKGAKISRRADFP